MIWAGGLWFITSHRPEPAPAIEQVNPLAQSFLVDCAFGDGSCIPIRHWQDFTIFLTAKHVIRDEPLASMTVDGKPVTRVEEHPTLDVALLWVQTVVPIVDLDSSRLEFGDEVFAAAWVGGHRILTHGYLSDFNTCSANAFFGMSGGGIFRSGRLIGTIIQLGQNSRGIVPFCVIFVPISATSEWIRDTIPS